GNEVVFAAQARIKYCFVLYRKVCFVDGINPVQHTAVSSKRKFFKRTETEVGIKTQRRLVKNMRMGMLEIIVVGTAKFQAEDIRNIIPQRSLHSYGFYILVPNEKAIVRTEVIEEHGKVFIIAVAEFTGKTKTVSQSEGESAK